MLSHWKNSDDFFARGYKSLVLGIFCAGSFLISLAVMFFIFPAFIGIIFAAFMFLVGVSTLHLGYKFWKSNRLTLRSCKIETRSAYEPWSHGCYQRIFFIER